MSDFLSQFSGEGTRPLPPQNSRVQDTSTTQDSIRETARAIESAGELGAYRPASSGVQPVKHTVEVDRNYNRKRAIRIAIVLVVVLLLVVAGVIAWNVSRLVEMPQLVGKSLSEAQTFSKEHGIVLDLTQDFSSESSGTILDQGVVAGRSIYKDSTLKLTVSKGVDPDQLLALPDFSIFKISDVRAWIEANQADNLRVTEEFSDTVAAGAFIKIEFRDEEVTTGNYRRRDAATVYYSKGVEVFEKNIEVPDFTDTPLAEAEEWAEENGIELTQTESESDTVEAGNIISQSVAAGEKMAKKETIAVVVSLGKSTIVPNFANLSAEEAASASEELQVTVEERYHDSVAYGRFISQSIAAGTKLKPGETASITVVYSLGKPYLKDYRGLTEGELPALFFEDYNSKGANITYKVRYVDSSEPKGTVVKMSKYSAFVSLKFKVTIDISKGNLKPKETDEKEDTKTKS
jgi:serine/threonine-protein kinase